MGGIVSFIIFDGFGLNASADFMLDGIREKSISNPAE
jgi:hypothetical protein